MEYAGVNTFRAGRMDELKMHPTVKPVALIADAMRDCSRRGSIILDSFAGSGTSIMAAEQIGRRAFCMEIDPRYVDVAIRRWQRFTGRDAILETTGQTFDELVAARGNDARSDNSATKSESSERGSVMRKKPTTQRASNYQVGKGRPPLATRWKPGQSGNLRGRPKGAKNLITILEQTLNQKVKVQDKGKIRQITVLEAIAKRLAHDAVKGNHKAITLLLGYEPEIARSSPPLYDPEPTYDTDFPADRTARAAATYFKLVRGGRS